MTFSNFLAAELLDHIFTDGAYSPPGTLYLALSTTAPAEDGTNVTEPSGNNYSRVSTVAGDWGAATVANPSVKANTAQKDFPEASGSWGTISHFALYDASTDGNMLASGALAASRAITTGDVARFRAGDLTLTLT